jgi:hypothetical protein
VCNRDVKLRRGYELTGADTSSALLLLLSLQVAWPKGVLPCVQQGCQAQLRPLTDTQRQRARRAA